MTTKDTFIVETEYKFQEVWDALTGSDFAGLEYWVEEMNCDYSKVGKSFPVTHLSKNDESKTETTIVTKDMIISGFSIAMQAGETHCGGLPIFGQSTDSCCADTVLQCAIFGKVVFG